MFALFFLMPGKNKCRYLHINLFIVCIYDMVRMIDLRCVVVLDHDQCNLFVQLELLIAQSDFHFYFCATTCRVSCVVSCFKKDNDGKVSLLIQKTAINSNYFRINSIIISQLQLHLDIKNIQNHCRKSVLKLEEINSLKYKKNQTQKVLKTKDNYIELICPSVQKFRFR